MTKRADDVAATRERIVEAAVRLHGTIGPAQTSIAGIAEEAGVTRLTVYRHFPNDTELHAACREHWFSQQRLPDPQSWSTIIDPEQRLRVGLADLYRFYREGQNMLRLVHRDIADVPGGTQQQLLALDATHRDTLLEPFHLHGPTRRRARAALGHAVSFTTWHSLCNEQHLTSSEAVDTMATLALTLARHGTAARVGDI